MQEEIEKSIETLGELVFGLAKSQFPRGRWGTLNDGIQAQAVLEKAAKKIDRAIPGRSPDTELAVHELMGLIYRLQGGDADAVVTDEKTIQLLCHAYLALGYVSAKLSRPRDFSKLGKSGASNRHAPMRELKNWVLSEYQRGTWKSANQAAHAMKESAIAHGRTIGAHLTEANAQRTIAGWISQARKPA